MKRTLKLMSRSICLVGEDEEQRERHGLSVVSCVSEESVTCPEMALRKGIVIYDPAILETDLETEGVTYVDFPLLIYPDPERGGFICKTGDAQK